MHGWRFPSALGAGLVLALLAAAPSRADVPVPPVARVTDLTATLTAEQQAALAQRLADVEQTKGSQIAVLIVPTTAPEDIEQFGIRVADAWKLGRKGVDDGAILIVALNDRTARIEVGRGLEGAVPDLDASRIIREYLRPHFRSGDFYGGINAALDRLLGLVNGEPLPPPAARTVQHRGNVGGVLPILLILGLIAGPILRNLFGRPVGAVATGGIAGFVAWLLIGIGGIALLVGVLGFVFTLLGGLGGGRWTSGGPGGFGGGLGGIGGGFGGFGGGGGGFSGGGGGFSGGGASGSW
jgi:uncharacterized protein